MMDNQSQTNTATDNQSNQEEPQESQGIDSVIAKVESYIQDPKMVTPETLMDLKNDLMDLKDYMDNPDQGMSADQGGQSEPNGVAIMIGRQKGGMR